MQNYESVLVLDSALPEEGQKLLFQKLKKLIQQFKGSIHHIDTWGARKLANKNAKKWAQGLYFHFSFNGNPGVVAEMVRQLRINEKVLYHHFEKLKKDPKEHLADFRYLVEEASRREKDRQARLQKRKSFLSKKTVSGGY